MDKALVLAGNSFLGRHVIDRLGRGGIDVIAASRIPRPGFLPCDITSQKDVDALIAAIKPCWLIQCAGATATSSRADMDRVHLDGTRKVLQAIARHVPNALVMLFGSAAEYGEVDPDVLPIKEDCPAHPVSPFGQSKLAQLRLACELANEFGLRVLTLRPFNIIGPGLPEHYLPGALARRLRTRILARQFGPFPVSNAQATRDWVDVRDVAEAVVRLLIDTLPARGRVEIYNVCSGKETSVFELAQKLCELAGSLTAIPGENVCSRSGISRSCGDAGRLKTATGWRAQLGWAQSLEELWHDGAWAAA